MLLLAINVLIVIVVGEILWGNPRPRCCRFWEETQCCSRVKGGASRMLSSNR
jgi:hypothetical protein